MLFDTTYKDRKTERAINLKVGKPFSFIERWRLKGIGSKRMTILDISTEYRKYISSTNVPSNGNIELRPKGVIIHFRHKLETYSWAMSYADLQVEKGASLKLTAEGKFITLSHLPTEHFLSKLLSLQNSTAD